MKFDYVKKKELLKNDKKSGEHVEIETESVIIDDDAVKIMDKFINKLTDKFMQKIDVDKITDTIKTVFKVKIG